MNCCHRFRTVLQILMLTSALNVLAGCKKTERVQSTESDSNSRPVAAVLPVQPKETSTEALRDRTRIEPDRVREPKTETPAKPLQPRPEPQAAPKVEQPKEAKKPEPEPSKLTAGSWISILDPDNSFAYNFRRGELPAFKVSPIGWGPNWSWASLGSRDPGSQGRVQARTSFVANKQKGETIDIRMETWQPTPQQVAMQYDLQAAQDVPLTMIVSNFGFDANVGHGPLTLTSAEGKSVKHELPVRGKLTVPATAQVQLDLGKGGNVTLKIDPPCPIGFDNGMRVIMASEVFRKGSRRVTMTLTFNEKVDFLVTPSDLAKFSRPLADKDWFAFTPSKDPVKSDIDMSEWLDAPAGRRGGVRMVKDAFQLEDGTPIKFWGTNLSYALNAPEPKTAAITAARFAKYGINAVRMHKFTGPGWRGIGDPSDATRMTVKGMDQLDNFAAQLKHRGIYFGWSHTYHFIVQNSNRNRLLAYDEIAKNLNGDTYALINFAEDIQDLMIEMAVNLLKHKNPYTGKTYAEEPALCFIELQNEDDIFFYTSEKAFSSCPTYKKRFQERFAAWLKEKYGTQEKLQAAWGMSLKSNEKLADASIVPNTNPWFFSSANLPHQKGGNQRRLLDTAAFLHDAQNRFYTKYVKAIRDAGYRGPLIGSPWQAPAMLPHYYNLYSDYLVGAIDRHNYFGGSGPESFDSMLTQPGSGYLGTGLQQVIDRPFAISEWIHVYPNRYTAEGPPIVAAYGMGLQGWDASYEFQSQIARSFSEIVGKTPFGVWETDVPSSLGQFPTLARMVHRGDVKQGETISVRRVSPSEMAEGQFGFTDTVDQKGDVKVFGGSVPAEALAAGRVVVEFPKTPQPSQLPDLTRYKKGSVIKSGTGELDWDTSGQGFFTVNTAGTKAVVGFAEGKEQTLGNVKIRLDTKFASLFLTAMGPKENLATGKRALISVIARQSNTGFTYFELDGRILENGGAPILLEPVKATITIADREIESVNILDHDGRRTKRSLPVKDGQFTLDGTKDKALYYEIIFR